MKRLLERIWLAAAALVMLSAGGCAQGDFGRPHRSLMGDYPHDWIGFEAVGSVGLPVSNYPLTDDERQLRDLAYPLINPPYGRSRWLAILAERGLIRDGAAHGVADKTDYLVRLTGQAHRSPASRYARLIGDSRNDVVRLDLFFTTARRVSDMDGRRQKSLAYISDPTPDEQDNALARRP